MIIPFQNILFLKEFMACSGCFGLLTKIKKRLGLAFRAHYLHDFFYRNVYLILYQWTKVQCHTFFLSQNIKQNAFLSFHLDS